MTAIYWPMGVPNPTSSMTMQKRCMMTMMHVVLAVRVPAIALLFGVIIRVK